MSIERDLKLLKEQLPSLIRNQVETAAYGLRNQLLQTLDARLADLPSQDPTPTPPDPRIPILEEQITLLRTQVDALDRQLRHYIETDRLSLTRSMVIKIMNEARNDHDQANG